ncbi:MAG TPA: SGNH hydrolase domain-containing protein, partial [Acidimicrobiales bacterium]|nr:SGNH hydrolase domain-containing protein [Acidimicrobiales bacterium]
GVMRRALIMCALAACALVAPLAAIAGARSPVAHTLPTPVLAPGLTRAEHTALVRSGAYGQKPITMLLVGDSIALTLGIGLSVDSQQRYGITISNHSTLGCDLDPTLPVLTSDKIGPATAGCSEWRALWPFLTAGVHPEVVALGLGRWETSDHYFEGHWVHIGQPVWDAHVASDLRQAIAIFQTFGAKVVLLTMPYIDPPDLQPDGQPFVENTPARTQDYNRVVAQVARADPGEVTAMALNHMLSPGGTYTATVDGVLARWSDNIHVSNAGGEFLQRDILPIVDRLGLSVEKTWAEARARGAKSRTTKTAASP